MNVRRFVGRSSREAMRKLREALGPDALVLANRPCADGVELLATAPGVLDAFGAPDDGRAGSSAASVGPGPPRPAGPHEPAPAAAVAGADAGRGHPEGMSTVSFQDYVRQRLRERDRMRSGAAADGRSAARPASREPAMHGAPVLGQHADPLHEAPMHPTLRRTVVPPMPALQPSGRRPAQPRGAAPDPHPVPPPDALVAELQSLRTMLSRQLATVSWFEGVRRSPVQGRLLRTMVAAGFSLKLARSVVSKLPSDHRERDAQTWLEAVLARNLRSVSPSESFEAGGVYALVGPTGVGKTTTTAKIAARHVLAHGAQSVALITVDTYRLGAHDQLRAFGRILGVPVHIAHDASALHDLLRLRGSRRLVLIDTVGMGHRDERIRTLLLSLPRADIRHVVVASAASQAETVDESLRAYEARLAAGVVLTKVDEAARLGGALDCLLRQRLRLIGICDGQRVPEDWQAADPARLVRRALLAPPAGAFALDDEELPLVFGVAATLQGDAAHA